MKKILFLFLFLSIIFGLHAKDNKLDVVIDNLSIDYSIDPQKNEKFTIETKAQKLFLFQIPSFLPPIIPNKQLLFHSNYRLEPLPGDFDVLKEVLPIVELFTIVNNKFGVGLGIRL